MSTEVAPSDWAALDRWWSAYTQTESIARRPDSTRVLRKAELTDWWDEPDPWWRAYTEASPAVGGSAPAELLGVEELADHWDELDPWWGIYTETGHATAVELADLLGRSNEAWRRSDGQFDTDPLAVDLTLERLSRGPLQPSGEVGWSRWLARLLRPSGALLSELFGVEADEAPSEVSREDRVLKEDGNFRRPDVLIFYRDRGVSIEVKLGDENYRKTAETAGLIEDDYDERTWTHVLLLPERKRGRLGAIVEPSLDSRDDGRRRIGWDDPGPVEVLYWRDVTAAIRSLLRRGEIVDDHWAANAYLFCAVAEQRIVDFQPQPVIERLADPVTVVDAIRPIEIAETLEEQLTYLREMVGA